MNIQDVAYALNMRVGRLIWEVLKARCSTSPTYTRGDNEAIGDELYWITDDELEELCRKHARKKVPSIMEAIE